MASGIVLFFAGLIPLSFIIAFCGLELGIAFIQAQVFVVLSSSYIRDALELHSDSNEKEGSKTNLYKESETQCKNISPWGASGGNGGYNNAGVATNQPASPPKAQPGRKGRMGIRFYSTTETSAFTSVVKYCNADVDKLRILSENKGKCGVYMFTHIASEKRYIGSSLNLRRRFTEYFNIERLLRVPSMIICRALLKYGYSAFSLEILVYCDRDELMREEKFYLDLLKPEWNILKIPGSPFRGSGWKHSKETRERMKISQNNRSAEVRLNMSKGQLRKEVIVTDITTGTITKYHAINAVARALGINKKEIENYIGLKQVKPVLNKYTFELVGDTPEKALVQLSTKIEVTDLTLNRKTVYLSIGLAARALGVRQSSISTYFSKGRILPFKKMYLLKKLGVDREDLSVKKSIASVIEVTDLTDGEKKTIYSSISAAAKALGIARGTVNKYMIETKPYKGKYLIKNIKIDRYPLS